MEANLRTTDLNGVTICDIGFTGEIGEYNTAEQKQAEGCVDVFHYSADELDESICTAIRCFSLPDFPPLTAVIQAMSITILFVAKSE